ncbi:MAG: isoleucine--tRNA ligase [Candidatus Kerfeldbacteria bacterium]|nr:isoleucine--tRNA ligase [Candidatus Kerfeldbacteria bacterium]
MQKTDRAASGLPNFPQLEEEVLEQWKANDIFQKSLEQTANGPRFVFFEGPPTANGRPGIHHVLARVFKDVIPRYKTMRGFFVERKAGWDTHGLPAELEVEKQLGLKSKKEIDAYGVQKFNEVCRESVWKYKEEWEQLTERIGFWLDLEHPYITYEPAYVESLWWIIKQVWDKQLLYQGHKVVPHCPRCGTALSSHEVAQGYRAVTENSVYVKFRVTSDKLQVKDGDTFILAWTTTPWTLPGNVALAVHPELSYVFAKQGNDTLVVAEPRLAVLGNDVEVVKKMKGGELVGVEYEPLFPFLDLRKESDAKAYYVAAADFVTVDDGTGVVHTAVMYGEDDYTLGEKIGLPKVHTVNEDGTFNELVTPWQGKFVKDPHVERAIVADLKSRGLLYKEEPYTHDYPFCWRCDSPLLYYAKNSWFIRMSALRGELKQRNATVNWVPEHIKDGRFGGWLDEAKDWAFSRERYWGTPLPIWVCEKDASHKVCVGSFDELRKLASSKLAEPFDPHRPFVDEVVLTCPNGDGQMRRIKELCDVWFDSGSMPYAQWHYPFENQDRIDNGTSYPADYISEAIDQTRGWFYTLLAVATLLEKDAPYKNVISLGHILDAKGQKMSKSKGNVVDPWKVIDEYGADALRLHLLTMNQPGEYKLFDPKQVGEVVRKTFLILWNVLSFRDLFAVSSAPAKLSEHLLDRWLTARLTKLNQDVTFALDRYDLTISGRALAEFVTDLSTWYVRRSRSRFKAGGVDAEAAAATLTTTLRTLAILFAPFTPFFAEMIYRRVGGDKPSVHLEPWPTASTTIDDSLLTTMGAVRKIVETGHALREEAAIKVRQPLGQFVVTGIKLSDVYLSILRDELNVREVIVAATLPSGVDWKTKQAGAIGLALDTTISDELKAEGWYRDVVRQVNDLRKKTRLTLADRITVRYATSDEQIRAMMTFYDEQIRAETRATELKPAEKTPDGAVTLTLGTGTLALIIQH